MLDIINIIMFICLVSETLPSLRGDPYASSDEDETYHPPDDSESNDSDDSSNDVDRTQ